MKQIESSRSGWWLKKGDTKICRVSCKSEMTLLGRLNSTHILIKFTRHATTRSSRRGRSCLRGMLASRSLSWSTSFKSLFCRGRRGPAKRHRCPSFCWSLAWRGRAMSPVLSPGESQQCRWPSALPRRWTFKSVTLLATLSDLKTSALMRHDSSTWLMVCS